MGKTGTGRGMLAALCGTLLLAACAMEEPADAIALAEPELTCGVADCSTLDVPAPLTAEDLRGEQIAASVEAMTPAARADMVLAAFEAAGCPPDIPIGGDAYDDYYDRVLQTLGTALGMQGDEWRTFNNGLDNLAMDEGLALVAAGRLREFDSYAYEPVACAGDSV